MTERLTPTELAIVRVLMQCPESTLYAETAGGGGADFPADCRSRRHDQAGGAWALPANCAQVAPRVGVGTY